MPTYEIQAPNGKTYRIDGPSGATQDQVRQKVLEQHPDAGSAKVATSAQPPAASKPSTAMDILKGGASGLISGIAGIAGQGGDLERQIRGTVLNSALNLGNAGANLLRRPGITPQAMQNIQAVSNKAPTIIPSSQPVMQDTQRMLGSPQTTSGKYAQAIASMAPAAFGGGGGLVTRAARVIVPGVASEAAGQMTQGKPYEQAARIAGALAGGAGVGTAEGIGARMAADKANAGAMYVEKIAKKAPPVSQTSASPQILAEALGKQGQTGLAALARREGTTGDILSGTLSQRAIERPDRIMTAFEDATGISPAAIKGDVEGIVQAGRDKAAPLFKEVQENPNPIMTPKLQELSKRPVIQKAMAQAYTDAQNAGIKPTAVGIKQVVSASPGGDLPVVTEYKFENPTASTWDKVYKNISTQVERHPLTQKPLPDSVSRGNHNINVARQDLRGELKIAVPKWDEAMTIAGDYKPVEAAFEMGGKTMFDSRVPVDQYAVKFAKLSKPEQEAWQGSVAHQIFTKAQNGQLTPALLKTPLLQQKMIATFGKDGADKLTQALGSEKAMLDFERRYAPGAGSITSEITQAQAQQDALNPAAEAAFTLGENVLKYGNTGGLIKTGAGYGRKVLDALKTKGMSVEARDEAGRLLMMSPQEYRQLPNRGRIAAAPKRMNLNPAMIAAALAARQQGQTQ